jgi:hypothetical protein
MRARSLHKRSISKNVPDRNLFDCAFMLTPDGWDCRFAACGTYGKHFPRFEFFLLPNRIHARQPASDANLWAAILLDLSQRELNS